MRLFEFMLCRWTYLVRVAVEVVDILKPVYNFKTADDTPPWVKKTEACDPAADA